MYHGFVNSNFILRCTVNVYSIHLKYNEHDEVHNLNLRATIGVALKSNKSVIILHRELKPVDSLCKTS